jgi:transcriptional regulator with XRE-family HTH domain
MVKLSELHTADQIHERDLKDPQYRAEHERTRFANEVAVELVQYRTAHQLTQRELAEKLNMRQPHIARLESGEHEPKLSTLQKLSSALDLEISVDIKPNLMHTRVGVARQPTTRRKTAPKRRTTAVPSPRVPVRRVARAKVATTTKNSADAGRRS